MSSARPGRFSAVAWMAGAASIAMLLWMGRSLVTGEIPFTGDLLHWNYPIRDFYAAALARGQRVWWMPSIYGGFDVAGEGQLGVFHPLHWVLYRLLSLDRAFAVELVLPYGVLLAGTWIFLRRIGAGPAAAFGALAFAFCGFNLQHGVHMNMVAVVAHVPWLLWAAEGLCVSPERHLRRRYVSTIALLTGSQVLFGHPQAVWWSVLIVGSYVMCRGVARDDTVRDDLTHGDSARSTTAHFRTTRREALTALIVAGVLGVGIGAVQLFATLYEVQHSARPVDDLTFVTGFSLPPLQLLQMLEPYAFWGRIARWNEAPGAGDEFAAYAGAVTLSLAVWWMSTAIRQRSMPSTRTMMSPVIRTHRRVGWWAAGLAVLGLWLAVGTTGGLYYLQLWLPLVRGFRAPVRYVLFTQLGVTIMATLALVQLAGMGAAARTSANRTGDADVSRRTRSVWAPWMVAAISAVAAWWLTASGRVPSAPIVLAVGPALFAAAALLITIALRGSRPAVLTLVVLTAVDLATYGLAGVVAWQDFVTRTQAEGFLEQRALGVAPGDGRIARGGFPDLNVLGGYHLIDGYVGLVPKKMLDYRTPEALRVAGVKYAHVLFLGLDAPAGATSLGRGWFKLPDPLPRAHLVGVAVASSDPASDLPRIDTTRAALTVRPLQLDAAASGSAAIVSDDPGSLRLEITATGTQLLVVSESFNDGWSAVIDGQQVPVEHVNGDFLGVVVPAGRHTVTLDFAPPYFRAGGFVSVASLAAVALLLATARPARAVRPL